MKNTLISVWRIICFTASFPAKKEINGLSIEPLSATDAQLSYKILTGFQP